MGGIFQAIGDWVGQAFNNIVSFVEALFTDPLNALLDYIVEPIMNFLGFHDEDIYRTSVIAVKIYNEDTFKKTQLRQVLDYVKNKRSSMDYAKSFANVGDTQFGKFYRHGKWDYLDYLPDAKISAVTIPVDKLKSILVALKGEDVFIIDALGMVPYDKDWCKWRLQEEYGYNIGEDFLIINNKYYKYEKEVYNTDTNDFTVTLAIISPIKDRLYETVITETKTLNVAINTYTQTDITIAEFTTNSDLKTTSIKEVKSYVYNNKVIDEVFTEISSTDDIIPKGSESDSSNRVLINSVTESTLIEITTTTQHHVYTRDDTGSILYESNPVITSTKYKKVTVTSSKLEIADLISEKDIIYPTEYITKTVANHNNIKQYVVKYTTTNDGNYYYWIYNPVNNTYPDLSTPAEQIIGFELYPVVMLRNNFFNVNDYDQNKINGQSRPPTITEERYLDTVDILDAIGVSLEELTKGYSGNSDIEHLQDAFFLFGVSPSNDKEIVSRVLFELFDFIYDTMPFVTTDSGYSAMFRENPYNAAIAWTPEEPVLKDEVIGSLGTCKHTAKKTNSTTTTYEIKEAIAIGNNRYKIISYTLTEITDNINGLLSSKKQNTQVITVDRSYTAGDNWQTTNTGFISKTVKESKSTNQKQLTVTKQITKETTKTLIMKSFTSFNIIRRGVENGGVSLDVDDENLVIPLPVNVVNRLTLMEKTALLGEAAYMLFYAYQHQHIKWYQTEAFGNFLQIVSIGITVVITIFSFGSGLAGGVTLTSILLSTLKSVAIGVGLQLALHLISTMVDDIGLKIALSVAAMAVAAYAGGAFDSFNLSTAVKLAELPAKAIDMYLKDSMSKMQNKLQVETQAFNEEYASRSEINTEIMKSFTSGLNVADIADITLADTDISATIMSPSEFYDIALRGCFQYDALYTGYYEATVGSFCANSLKLGLQETE